MEYAYIRASTNSEKQDLSRQIRFAKKHNVKDENIFQEYASGAKRDRKELNRLLSIIKEEDTIISSDVSRLSRSIKGLLDLVEIAKEKKLRLIFGDGFTLDCRGKWSIMTEMQLLTFGLVAEMQRLMIVDAVIDGLETARENGRIGGRPKTTIDNIPESFYKYYPMYKNNQINKKEFSRLSKLSYPSIYKYLDIVEKNNN